MDNEPNKLIENINNSFNQLYDGNNINENLEEYYLKLFKEKGINESNFRCFYFLTYVTIKEVKLTNKFFFMILEKYYIYLLDREDLENMMNMMVILIGNMNFFGKRVVMAEFAYYTKILDTHSNCKKLAVRYILSSKYSLYKKTFKRMIDIMISYCLFADLSQELEFLHKFINCFSIKSENMENIDGAIKKIDEQYECDIVFCDNIQNIYSFGCDHKFCNDCFVNYLKNNFETVVNYHDFSGNTVNFIIKCPICRKYAMVDEKYVLVLLDIETWVCNICSYNNITELTTCKICQNEHS